MATFAERMAGGKFPVAYEITPPKIHNPEVLFRRAAIADGPIQTVDVIQRVGRQDSLEAARELAGAGFDTIWHLVTNGTNPNDLSTELEHASSSDLNQVLVIKGDEPNAHQLTVAQAITLASQEFPNIFAGVAFNQYAKPLRDQIRAAFAKIRAGAAYIQTQPIFNFVTQGPTFETLKRELPHSKLVAMCMPITSPETARQIERSLKIPIEPELYDEIESGGPEAGWAHFQSTLRGLKQSNLFDGLVVMTYEADPPDEVRARIIESLRLI